MGNKILMICYYYPPLTDVGCKRSVAFSKYWREAGWQPHVLSVKNPDKTYCSPGDDKTPDGIEVTYTASLFNVYKFFGKINGLVSRILNLVGIKLHHNYFYDIFCIPDLFLGWIIPALISSLRIIRREKIDIIYISCSPFSAGVIGYWIKKITGKPLIIDYRDPFGLDISEYLEDHMPVKFRRPVDRWISGFVLKACDLFTVTSEETRQLYVDQFPFIRDKIHTVYNGFDRCLLDIVEEQEKFSRFTVIYTGNFYYDVEFDSFFEALGQLKQEGCIQSGNFQFLFYGGDVRRVQGVIKRYDVADLVCIKERIPYVEVLEEIKRSHLQLLRITQPMISTKLFEGIALDVPFLATVPAGEVEGLVREYSPGSFVVTDDRSSEIARSIDASMKKYMENELPANRVDDFLEVYSRKNQSLQFLELMKGSLRVT